MKEDFTYKDYVARQGTLEKYNEYQNKYAENPRESDKVILSLIDAQLSRHQPAREASLLDVGCSTGNLLIHIKRRFPQLRLEGGDLAQSSLEQCRANPALSGAAFSSIDMMDIARREAFDIITANAVTYLFTWEDYCRAMASVVESLAPGGMYISFEWLHPFVHQDIVIYETTAWVPEGIRICARPMPKVEGFLRSIGFTAVEFLPFDLPLDLPRPGYDQEVSTYTVRAQDGRNLCFRGALFQPWCHLVARKG